MPRPPSSKVPPGHPSPFREPQDPSKIEENFRVLAKAVEQSPVSVIITDPKGVIQYVNPKFTKLMGYTPEEAIGKTPRIIKGHFLPRQFYKEMWETILGGKEWHGVFHNRAKDGTLVWELASISPIRDLDGVITHFVGVKEDITMIKRLQEELDHISRHDQLTGLPNRILFNDRFLQALAMAKRRKASFALMYLDLNKFKPINDTYGHKAGDALLAAVSERLKACVRESDTVARMGGDEFTVIFNDIQGPEAAELIAGKIVEALSSPFPLEAGTFTIGVSIGISIYPLDGLTADGLMAKADAAMYRVKKTGGSGYQFALAD